MTMLIALSVASSAAFVYVAIGTARMYAQGLAVSRVTTPRCSADAAPYENCDDVVMPRGSLSSTVLSVGSGSMTSCSGVFNPKRLSATSFFTVSSSIGAMGL